MSYLNHGQHAPLRLWFLRQNLKEKVSGYTVKIRVSLPCSEIIPILFKQMKIYSILYLPTEDRTICPNNIILIK